MCRRFVLESLRGRGLRFELSHPAQKFLPEQAHLLDHFAFDFVQAAPSSQHFIAHIRDLVDPFSQFRGVGQTLIQALLAVLRPIAFMLHEPL